jgi:hypothetical protein
MTVVKKKKKNKASWQTWLVPGIVALVLLGVISFVVKIFLSDGGPRKKASFSMVTLIKPPPPEVKEKPPEPEAPKEVKKETLSTPIDTPQPQNQAQNDSQDDSPPAGDTLSVEGDGSAGPNAFGLGAKRPGTGRDVTLPGSGGGGMNRLSMLTKYGWYTSKVQEEIKKQFKKRMESEGGVPKGKKYKIVVSSGNEKMDKALKASLPGLRISQALPDGMPPLITLRIVSQG